mgnify:FL=1
MTIIWGWTLPMRPKHDAILAREKTKKNEPGEAYLFPFAVFPGADAGAKLTT